jgi:hypothetical protein
MYSNRLVLCLECGGAFPFEIEQQQVYGEFGFEPPTRCRTCFTVREQARSRVGLYMDSHGHEAPSSHH